VRFYVGSSAAICQLVVRITSVERFGDVGLLVLFASGVIAIAIE
jgi:hypothetical protein